GDDDMIILAVHGNVEFSRSEMEIMRHSRAFRFGRLERFGMEISPFTGLEEIPSDGREEREGKLILHCGCRRGHVFLQFFEFGLQPVSRPALYRLFIADGAS